jgi:hypothetical protein
MVEEEAGLSRPVDPPSWITVLRVAMPLVAVASGFLPWLYAVAPGSHPSTVLQIYSLYRLSVLSWLWLVITALLTGSVAIGQRMPMRKLRDKILLAYAAVSFGTALTAIVCVHVAGLISADLSAPTPVALGYGVWVFGAAAFLWTLVSVFS